MSPQPEWTAERLDALERDLRDYAERDSGEEHDVEDDCRYQAADAIRHLRQQQPAASTSDEQRARLYGEENAADLDEAGSRDWLVQNHVRYVLPWRVEDEEKLVAQFAAVRAEARRAALEEAAAACDSLLPNPEPYTPDVHSGADWRAGLARAARVIRALAAQEVKP